MKKILILIITNFIVLQAILNLNSCFSGIEFQDIIITTQNNQTTSSIYESITIHSSSTYNTNNTINTMLSSSISTSSSNIENGNCKLENPLGEFKVNKIEANEQNNPDIATNGDGSIILLAWNSLNGDADEWGTIGKLINSCGETIKDDFNFNNFATHYQGDVAIDMNSSGMFAATWQDGTDLGFGGDHGQDGDKSGIQARIFNKDGTPICDEFTVNEYTNGIQSFPKVAIDGTGNIIVVWVDEDGNDGSNHGVYAQYYNNLCQKVGSNFLVNTETQQYQLEPDVDMNDQGNFVIVWASSRPFISEDEIYFQIYDKNLNKLGSETQANTTTTDQQYFPSISLGNSGDFVISWISDKQDGDKGSIAVRKFHANGNAYSNDYVVNLTSLGEQWISQISMFSDESFFVTWESENVDGDNKAICGRYYDKDGITALSNEIQINSITAGNQHESKLTTVSSNSLWAIWMSPDSNGNGIKAKHISKNGSTL